LLIYYSGIVGLFCPIVIMLTFR